MSRDSADAELFRRLFEAHLGDLWRFARRRCHSSDDADDIAAQVFAIAWRRRNELPAADLRLWLFGVARLVLANHRRSTERQHRLQLRLVGDQRTAHRIDEPSVTHEELRAALAALSELDREVIVMRCWDGLAVTEIAAILDRTPNAVSVRLHKARQKMLDRLARTDAATCGHVQVDPQPRMEDRHGS